MSRGDWGRIGRRTEPFTVRVVCDQCGVEMSAPTAPDVCPLCDGLLFHAGPEPRAVAGDGAVVVELHEAPHGQDVA